MPRQSRKFSKSQVYHIIYKGIDGQDIFYEEGDKSLFLNKLLETKQEYQYKIYSYCLMANHIHLVIEIENSILATCMKSLAVKYVLYFNKKYSRSGPLFQNRFNSSCVENQKYFLDVCRYVHQNPEKAGICNLADYKWSSYNEYLGKANIIDKQILLHYFDNKIENFKRFTLKGKTDNEYDFIEYELRKNFDDLELTEFIIKKLKIHNINDISKMSKKEFEKTVEILKNMPYTNLSQIARIVRINRWVLEKYWKKI